MKLDRSTRDKGGAEGRDRWKATLGHERLIEAPAPSRVAGIYVIISSAVEIDGQYLSGRPGTPSEPV